MAIQLNLGCRNHILAGFRNIDSRNHNTQIELMDITHLMDIGSETVDYIYAAHVLQCLDDRSLVPKALKAWNRVLKPGGLLIVEVPNVIPLMREFIGKRISCETLIRGIYGVNETGIRQTCCFDFEYLTKLLAQAGFKKNEQINQPTYSIHDPHTNLVVRSIK